MRRDIRQYLADESALLATNEILERPIWAISLRILRLVEQTTSHLLSYRSSQPSDIRFNSGKPQLVTDLSHIDLSIAQDDAARILGKSPAEICENLFQDWRILHCENIMRSDLRRRFLSKQEKLKQKLLDVSIDRLRGCVPRAQRRHKGGEELQKVELISYLTTPRITFHGTPPQSVASIVQCGFLKPGETNTLTGELHGIRCGSTYGAGIYSSPNPAFALSYSGDAAEPTPVSAIPGLKLIICATLMGRPADVNRGDNWREQHEPYPGADSHTANNQLEYVVFDSAQILPCYVLHLDWRGRNDIAPFLQAKIRQPKPLHPRLRKESEVLAPGDVQRIKEEKMAQAKKFFAYGFGPLKGRDIVIEEIGEADDDEEDYGDYQKYRTVGDSGGAHTNVWDWGKLEGETEFDEFTNARKAKGKKKS